MTAIPNTSSIPASSALNDLSNSTRCQWCGGNHSWKCPLIKAIDFDLAMTGTWRWVEFFSPAEMVTPIQTIPAQLPPQSWPRPQNT